MRLMTLPADPEYDAACIRDLKVLLEQPTYKEMRACPGCNQPCPCSGSTTCTCVCGPDCELAPTVMSIEGDKSSVESKIVSMVFGLNCLRVCPPYWSCEGHTSAKGQIYRLPQVWFYSRSIIYPKIVGDLVLKLQTQGVIKHRWHVCLAHAENSLETGFCLEPDTAMIQNPSLPELQADTKRISENLVSGLRSMAQQAIRDYNLREKPKPSS